MDSDTAVSKLTAFVQRCRKAYRLYSSMSRTQSGDTARESELQLTEWGELNLRLSQSLAPLIEKPQSITQETLRIRNLFYGEWRDNQTLLVRKQKELLKCVESTDFIRASKLVSELIVLKAKCQASQAAFQELDSLFGKTQPQHHKDHIWTSESISHDDLSSQELDDRSHEIEDSYASNVLLFSARREKSGSSS